jgi:putative ABC transport system substrate-binding protein
MADQHADVLIVQADPFFTNRRDQLVSLSNRHAIPVMYPFREFSMAGGLISYGADIAEVFRQTGLYVGRILKFGASSIDNSVVPVKLPPGLFRLCTRPSSTGSPPT